MKTYRRFLRRVSVILRRPDIARYYLLISVVVLAVTTVAWALVGSIIELGNADQLANTFLAQDMKNALLPDQHTFLLKLPFFWLVLALGATPFAFCFVTVLITSLTVGLFALVLYKIEKRPFYISTIFLALALVLLMIPPQAFAGANLPVNMAMITTRNLEYVVYIAGLLLIVTSPRWRSLKLVTAAFVFGLLFASDKLFLTISLGASLILLVVSFIPRWKVTRQVSLRWLAVTAGGAIVASSAIYWLSRFGLLHSVGQGSVGPYGFVASIKSFAEAIIYGALSLFTNFGANPGFDGRTIPTVVSFALQRLASPLLPVYILTFAIFAAAIIAAVRVVQAEIKKKGITNPVALAYTLIVSTFAALFLFIVSNHYYPVDARYVAIVTFAGFVAIAAYAGLLRKTNKERLALAGVLLLIGIGLSSFFVTSTAADHTIATKDISERDALIAKSLKLHNTDTLIGDYWRVLPIKLQTPHSFQVVDPLSNCTESRGILNSTTWMNRTTNRSFGYLLSVNQATPNFPACTLQQVTTAYGRPDSSVVISGTVQDPKELLLFYDKGIYQPTKPTTSLTDTVLPAPLNFLSHTGCEGDTIMNVVAHEDDDILFMNPDLQNEIKAGNCIRTIYVTAGDAGSDGPYWLGRQQGSEAAYANMLGLSNPIWTERRIEVAPHQVVTVANPRGNPNISLLFMYLPDGSPSGQGFTRSGHQSLMKLWKGHIPSISSVDGASTYSNQSLIDALTALITIYKPSKLQTQSTQAGGHTVDHSDHTAVGYFVQAVNASTQLPITYYLGYPIHDLPVNISDENFLNKFSVFMSFSHHDGATCHSREQCDNKSVYGIYLRRQYATDH